MMLSELDIRICEFIKSRKPQKVSAMVIASKMGVRHTPRFEQRVLKLTEKVKAVKGELVFNVNCFYWEE